MTKPKLVTDDEMQEAAQASLGTVTEADLDRAEAEVPAVPETPPAAIPAPVIEPSLPSPDQVHANTLYLEDQGRLARYEQGLALLLSQRDNLQARYERELAEIERQIADHALCKACVTASIRTFEEATGK